MLPPANEVWGKVMFSQACVSHSVHKSVVGRPLSSLSARPPPAQRHPLPYREERAVRILLECILVYTDEKAGVYKMKINFLPAVVLEV